MSSNTVIRKQPMTFKTLFACFTFLALIACSADQGAADASAPASSGMEILIAPAPVTTSAGDPVENFDIRYSVNTLMNEIVQPNVLKLWQAVRYIATVEGVVEDVAPQTDEDWETLRASAITLVEAGNALLIPGRSINDAVQDADYPDYMYRSEEIEALIESDPEIWRSYIQQMQFFTQATLETIENKDVLGLIETGAAINNSCQGCHAEFWYRR